MANGVPTIAEHWKKHDLSRQLTYREVDELTGKLEGDGCCRAAICEGLLEVADALLEDVVSYADEYKLPEEQVVGFYIVRAIVQQALSQLERVSDGGDNCSKKLSGTE